jgi:hypothetical protein
MTGDGLCWNMWSNNEDAQKIAKNIGLYSGQRVLLFQDEGDFEVEAVLSFQHIKEVGYDCWVAKPDWSTRKNNLPFLLARSSLRFAR